MYGATAMMEYVKFTYSATVMQEYGQPHWLSTVMVVPCVKIGEARASLHPTALLNDV
mgnify:CR=1 FL=1